MEDPLSREALGNLYRHLCTLPEKLADTVRALLSEHDLRGSCRTTAHPTPGSIFGAISFLRGAFNNDGAEGESVYLICRVTEDLLERQKTLDDLDFIRFRGWTVAVHNDYRLNGKSHTFWLFERNGSERRGPYRRRGIGEGT